MYIYQRITELHGYVNSNAQLAYSTDALPNTRRVVWSWMLVVHVLYTNHCVCVQCIVTGKNLLLA